MNKLTKLQHQQIADKACTICEYAWEDDDFDLCKSCGEKRKNFLLIDELKEQLKDKE